MLCGMNACFQFNKIRHRPQVLGPGHFFFFRYCNPPVEFRDIVFVRQTTFSLSTASGKLVTNSSLISSTARIAYIFIGQPVHNMVSFKPGFMGLLV